MNAAPSREKLVLVHAQNAAFKPPLYTENLPFYPALHSLSYSSANVAFGSGVLGSEDPPGLEVGSSLARKSSSNAKARRAGLGLNPGWILIR